LRIPVKGESRREKEISEAGPQVQSQVRGGRRARVDGRARLIAYLVGLAEQSGSPTSHGICFQLTENNEQLATRLGTVRELISHNLGRLHGDKLIEMNKRTVKIPNLSVLRDEIERGG